MYHYKAELVRVVDGDTVDLDVKLGFKMTAHIRFRLKGINAPETRGKEKDQGNVSKQFLVECLKDKPIQVESHKTGKYGRWLGVIFIGDINVNDLMVNQGHAVYKKY